MQTSFNFAWGSVKSDNKVEVGEGVTLLMGGLQAAGARDGNMTCTTNKNRAYRTDALVLSS